MVRADGIGGLVQEITERHDAYVKQDAALTEQHKAVYLRSAELLRAVVAEAIKK